MTYPIPNYTRVWVRGRIIDLGKAALQEDNYGLALPVTFSPSPKVLLNAGTGQIISTASFKITPAAQDGYFAIQLPATDDPDINPTNFTYAVKEPTGRSYNIVVPAATPLLSSPGDPLHGQPVLDLITIVPSPPAGAGSVQLMRGRGIESLVIDASSHLIVTFDDGVTQDLGLFGGGAVSDATTGTKGVSRLLGGTADAPTVPATVLTGTIDDAQIPSTVTRDSELTSALVVKAPLASPAFTGTPTGITKTHVGLGSVDNTSDAAKPISTSTAAGLVSGQRLMPAPKTVLSRFAVGHAWTGGTDDTAIKLYGDRSYKGTTDGLGANKTLSAATGGVNQDWTASYVRVVLRVDDVNKLGATQLWLDAGTSVSYFAQLVGNTAAENIIVSGQWMIFTVPRAAFSVSGGGTPSWTTITRPRLVFKDRAAGAVTAYLAAVELLPDLSAIYPNGVLVVEADDGYAAQKTLLRPMLDSLGVPCTVNPIIERITSGAAGITIADLRDMQDYSGWQISGHAYNQTFHDTPGASAATASADFAATKAWLHANGFHAGADDYSLCPGSGSPPSAAMRSTLGSYWRSARLGSGYFETVIPGDLLAFRSLLFSGNTVVQLQSNIDQAAGAGGVFHLSIHDVLVGATNGVSNGLQAIAIDNLRTVVQYALSKGMVARTRSDWLTLR